MATISTKPVGTTQPATQPTEAVKTEKPKASEATSSSIASLAKSETQPAKKSCWQKVKDCCAKVIAWIKEHILCCFFKKDEAKIEQEKKAKEAKEKEQAEKKKAEEDKAKFTKWFNSLTVEQQKECKEGLEAFTKEASSAQADVEKGIKQFSEFFVKIKENAKNKNWAEIKKGLENSPFAIECKNAGLDLSDVMDIFAKKPQILEAFADAMVGLLKKEIQRQKEIIGACSFLEASISDRSKLSQIQIRYVFSSLSSQEKAILLQCYKDVNQKTEITEDQLLALLENRKDEGLKKWMAGIPRYMENLIGTNKDLEKRRDEFHAKLFEQIKAASSSPVSIPQYPEGVKGKTA